MGNIGCRLRTAEVLGPKNLSALWVALGFCCKVFAVARHWLVPFPDHQSIVKLPHASCPLLWKPEWGEPAAPRHPET